MRHIKIETGADGIAILTLDHATESMNVITDEWLAEMNAALAQLRQRHGALRIATAGALAQIDTLISAFDAAPASDSRQ